ncbi:MAG TPA: VOC family protein [Acidimicrobiales bacterium]|nr:VOC family protein [Acidimicrobiales bacterium]
MFLGLRTAVYPATDLSASKAWYCNVLGIEPYFDEPFYVGFNVGGYELGLVPREGDSEPTTYWGVPDIDAALARLLADGAKPGRDITDVGDGIRVAAVREPGGGLLGLIENPHFVISRPSPVAEGPGR